MFDHRVTRKATVQLLEMVDEGLIDRDSLIQDLLGWMSEDEVAEFARRNDYIQDEDEDDEYDGQPDEAQEWYDFDPDC